MKKTLKIIMKLIGVGLCLVFLLTLRPTYLRYKIYEKGKYVPVKITEKRVVGGRLTTNWVHFVYRGKEYSKVAASYYDEVQVGDTILLKHIDGMKYFLFKTEDPKMRFYLNIPFLLIGLYFLLHRFKLE